jgi:hypothetical protein
LEYDPVSNEKKKEEEEKRKKEKEELVLEFMKKNSKQDSKNSFHMNGFGSKPCFKYEGTEDELYLKFKDEKDIKMCPTVFKKILKNLKVKDNFKIRCLKKLKVIQTIARFALVGV